MQINMLDFLRTGGFGDIKLGISRIELFNLLGEPLAWLPNKVKDFMFADSWYYKQISFDFTPQTIETTQEGLYRISISNLSHKNDRELPPLYTLDMWELDDEPELDLVIQHLRNAGLNYKQLSQPQLDTVLKQISLELDSGVELIFQQIYYFHDNESSYKPEKFYLTTITHSQPISLKNPTKQLSVNIPIALYEKLQRLSQKHHQSMSSICSELLIPILFRIPDTSDE